MKSIILLAFSLFIITGFTSCVVHAYDQGYYGHRYHGSHYRNDHDWNGHRWR